MSVSILFYYISKYSEMIDQRLNVEIQSKSATIYADSAKSTAADTPQQFMARYFHSSRTKRRFVEFEQITGVRQFMFDCISDEKLPAVRTCVSADLALARKYGISLQALPLLCRQLLEKPLECAVV